MQDCRTRSHGAVAWPNFGLLEEVGPGIGWSAHLARLINANQLDVSDMPGFADATNLGTGKEMVSGSTI